MPEGSFGKDFSEWRTEHGLSRRGMAEDARISTSHSHGIENDEFLPGIEVLERIGKAYGLDVDELVDSRNREFFGRTGLDGDVAAALYRLGDMNESEREFLLTAIEKLQEVRKALPELEID